MLNDQLAGMVIEIDADDVGNSISSFQEDLIEVDSSFSSINEAKSDQKYDSDLYSRGKKKLQKISSQESFQKINSDANDPILIPNIQKLKSKVNKREDILRNHYLHTSQDVKFLSGFNDIRFKLNISSILESESFYKSDYFGVYTIFWVIIGLYILSTMVDIYFGKLKPLSEWIVIGMFRRDLLKVGIVDLCMYISSYFPFFLQLACKNEILSWNKFGWIILFFYNLSFLVFWTIIPLESVMDLSWLPRIFLILHCLVFLMKMYSYSHYNGYLWEVYHEGLSSEASLQSISNSEVQSSEDHVEILEQSLWFAKHELEFQSNGTTDTKHHHQNHQNHQNHHHDYHNHHIFQGGDINKPFQVLQNEGVILFPNNLNLQDYFNYSMFPTLVYTLNFPRTLNIRWFYVFKKVCGTFALIFSMIIVTEDDFLPVMQEVAQYTTLPIRERLPKYLLVLSHIMLPLGKQYLLSFILIWNEILNGIAELSRFGDRHFYDTWWSSINYMDYSRKWNTVVHRFLRRHVYNSSINRFGLSKKQSTMLTLLLSAMFHELVMYILFGKLRGYLFLAMLIQIPLAVTTKFGSRVHGNIVFWLTYSMGPSLVSTLYLLF